MINDTCTFTLMNGRNVTALFKEATAEQLSECYTLASSTWGSYLDEDEVIAREQHLSTTASARDGGCRVWCTYRQDDHSQILSTCKTIRRDFLLRDSISTRQMEGVCIVSVFTASMYRGNGLASFMLRNVARWLDSSDGVFVSVLYSGMPRFYESLGWVPLPNMETILGISPWLQNDSGPYADLEVQSLSDADLGELCAQDVEHIKSTSIHALDTTEGNRWTILPTADLVRYQHALSQYMGDLWHFEAPKTKGAAYGRQAWLYWYHDFRSRGLYIQHIHDAIPRDEDKPNIMTALFLSAVREAKEWNFTTIATWDASPFVRMALERLAQANFFSKVVSESHRTQRISIRLRDGGINPSNIVMDNTAYAWNMRY